VLSVLLPGVREFRTPLVAGLLWFASFWLLAGSALIDSEATSKFVRDLDLEAIPSSAWVATTALFAYLIGSLLIVRSSPFGPYGPRMRDRLQGLVERLDEDRRPIRWRYRPAWHLWRWSFLRLPTRVVGDWVRGPQRPLQVDEWLRNEFESHMSADRVPVMRNFLGGCLAPTGFEGFCDARSLRADKSVPNIYEGDADLEALNNAFAEEVKREQPEAEVRIQMRHPELYAEIDRLKVEGEFRLSIFWPLLLLTIVLAWSWSPWVLVALVIPPLLVRDGFQRLEQGKEKVWGALIAREVTTPTLDAVENAKQTEPFDFRERYGRTDESAAP
jgi:hypothetical protein